MSATVTQCPKCKTAFRVTEAQLAAARGAVRCGACLSVFSATRHLLQPPEPEPAAAPPAPPPAAREPLFTIVDGPAHSEDPGEADIQSALREIAEPAPRQPARTERPAEAPPWREERDWPADDEDGDEAPQRTGSHWARALVEEIKRTPERPAPREPFEFDDEDEPPAPHTARGDFDFAADDDELEPDTYHRAPAAAHGRSREREPVHEEPSVTELDFSELMKATRVEEEADEDLLGAEPLQIGRRPPEQRSRPAPAAARRLPAGYAEHSPLATAGWALACTALVLALGLQVVLYRFDALVREPQWRPYFEMVCPSLGCEVPPLYDIAKIQSAQLVVRSHPTAMGALVVEAQLVNQADAPQPFPLLQLRFSDMNEQVVAERVFTPREYMGRLLPLDGMMPPGQNMPISLEIRDPGPTALNYALRFFPVK